MISERSTILNLLFVSIAILGAASRASAATENATIDSDKALRKITGSWYNSQSGTYQPPVLSKPIDDSIRKSGWLGEQKTPNSVAATRNWNWGNLGLSGELFGWIVFGVLGAVLLRRLHAIIPP
jgi:hypothetical protein